MASAEPLVKPLAKPDPNAQEIDPDLKDFDNVVYAGEAVLTVCTAGLWLLTGLYVVGPRETRVILHNGRLTHIESTPGLHWRPNFCREDRLQTTAQITWNLPELKVVDTTGVPITVSAVLVYRIADCKKALLDVVNVHKYVQAQASAALKLIVSKCAHRRAQA